MGRPGWGACSLYRQHATIAILIHLLQPADALDYD
jgi:hypothetical protein